MTRGEKKLKPSFIDTQKSPPNFEYNREGNAKISKCK